jgi:hypothetical protein
MPRPRPVIWRTAPPRAAGESRQTQAPDAPGTPGESRREPHQDQHTHGQAGDRPQHPRQQQAGEPGITGLP